VVNALGKQVLGEAFSLIRLPVRSSEPAEQASLFPTNIPAHRRERACPFRTLRVSESPIEEDSRKRAGATVFAPAVFDAAPNTQKPAPREARSGVQGQCPCNF